MLILADVDVGRHPRKPLPMSHLAARTRFSCHLWVGGDSHVPYVTLADILCQNRVSTCGDFDFRWDIQSKARLEVWKCWFELWHLVQIEVGSVNMLTSAKTCNQSWGSKCGNYDFSWDILSKSEFLDWQCWF